MLWRESVRRRLVAALAVGALAVTLPAAGCGGDDDGEAPGRATTVEVLEPGAEPRRTLELGVSEGEESTVWMELDMSIEHTLAGGSAELPAVKLVLTMEARTRVDEVREDEIDYSFEVTGVEVTEGGGGDPDFASQFGEELKQIEGVRGEATVTASGALVESRLALPEGIDPAAETFVEQIDRELGQLAVPFPSEPIGPGARWTATMDLEAGGIDTEYRATYTLEELDGENYVAPVELELRTHPGPVDDPELEEGETAEVLTGSFAGSGRNEGSLARLVPDRGAGELAGSQEMEFTFEGQSERLEQRLRISFVLTARS